MLSGAAAFRNRMRDAPSPLVALDGSEVGSMLDVAHIDDAVYRDRRAAWAANDFGDLPLYDSWFRRNPSIYTFLLAGDKLVGYVNAMPLADAVFQEVLAGKICDRQIEPGMIRTYTEPGRYKLYLCSVAILPEFRSGIGLWLVYVKFKSKIRSLRQRGMEVAELAGVAWSGGGLAIFRSLGLKYHSQHKLNGDIYHGSWTNGQFLDQLP
jgi:hypothetical protein